MIGPGGLSPETARVVDYVADAALAAAELSLSAGVTGVDVAMLRQAAADARQTAELLTGLASGGVQQLEIENAHLVIGRLPGREFGERLADPYWRPREVVPDDVASICTVTIADDHTLVGLPGTQAEFPSDTPEEWAITDMLNVLGALRKKGVYGREMQARWSAYWPSSGVKFTRVTDRLTRRLSRVAGFDVLQVVRVGPGGAPRWKFDPNVRIADNRAFDV